MFLFVRDRSDLWIYALVWSLSTLLGNLLCLPSLRGRVSFRRVPLRESLQHLGPCAVLFVSVIAVSVYRTMDKVMVSWMAGLEQNGQYENAEKIIYCLSGFISAIGTVMMPKISNMLKKGQMEAIRTHIDKSMNLVLCMVCALAFGVAAVADAFAPLFYGEDFAYSGTLMIPLSFTLITIGFANVIRTQWILPQGRDYIFVRSVCTGAVVNLIANLCLIPSLKSMGAVMGTLLAETSVPLIQLLILRRELPYGTYLGYLGIYAMLGAVMLAAVRLAAAVLPLSGWPGLLCLTMIGIFVYGLLALCYWHISGKHFERLLPGFRRKG